MRVRRACRSLHYSPRFNGQFSDGRGLAGTRMSPFWILLQLRMLKAVVTTGDKSYAELQSNRRHQQTNSEHFTGWMPFLSPNEQCQSEHWKEWSLCFHRKKSIRLFFSIFLSLIATDCILWYIKFSANWTVPILYHLRGHSSAFISPQRLILCLFCTFIGFDFSPSWRHWFGTRRSW